MRSETGGGNGNTEHGKDRISISRVKEDLKTGRIDVIWFTEKELEKEIKREMRGSCVKYADDFLPAALKIVRRAQVQAQVMLDDGLIARKLKKEKAKRKIMLKKKKKKRRNH